MNETDIFVFAIFLKLEKALAFDQKIKIFYNEEVHYNSLGIE